MKQRDILEHYIKIGEAFSQVLGKESKVIIRENKTSNQQILAIFNGNVAYQKENPKTSDIQLLQSIQEKEEAKEDIKKSKDNTNIKSITEDIKTEQGDVIGSFTIEWNIEKITQISELLHEFVDIEKDSPQSNLTSQESQGADNEIKEIITHYTNTSNNTQLNKKEQKNLIEVLYKKGIFNNKNSVTIVATQLGLSKPTIYNNIAQLKKRRK